MRCRFNFWWLDQINCVDSRIMCQMDITHHALCLVPISKHISWGRSYIFPRKSFLWVNRGPGTLKLWKTVKLLLSQPFCWLPFNKIQKSLQPRQDFNLHPHIYMYMVLYQLSLWSWSFVRENHILPKAENVSGESQLFVFSISNSSHLWKHFWWKLCCIVNMEWTGISFSLNLPIHLCVPYDS